VLNQDKCFLAHEAKDPRFDGVFFAGVSSTGIYCRTICPAKTPKRENLTFFPSATSAEAAGFRPCLRCRPELAPGHSAVDAVSRLATAAANRIEEDPGESLEALALNLGVSSRHLRRAIRQQFGVSPVELAQTQRLLFAKRLLRDTNMDIGEIAFAAGFKSLRRLNALIQERYHLTPSSLRRRQTPSLTDNDTFSFDLAYRPPYDTDAMLTWISKRCFAGSEAVVDGAYWRTTKEGWVRATFPTGRNVLRVEVSAYLRRRLPAVLRRLRNLFDLDADPASISSVLGDLANGNEGLRVPGAFDGFELAVRAIVGQQISVAGATTIARRLSLAFGEPLDEPVGPLTHRPISAECLAQASVDEVAGLGMPGARARTLIALGQAVVEGLRLSPGQPVAETTNALKAIPGIGEWTAQYVAMRALRWPDAFPAGDLGLQRAGGEKNAKNLELISQRWRPWRAYAAMHLWHSLERKHEPDTC
jgi:AraC family transcriptional regulator of adaptative response / DNA-3-methyladenine glycosylase II